MVLSCSKHADECPIHCTILRTAVVNLSHYFESSSPLHIPLTSSLGLGTFGGHAVALSLSFFEMPIVTSPCNLGLSFSDAKRDQMIRGSSATSPPTPPSTGAWHLYDLQLDIINLDNKSHVGCYHDR